MINFKSVVVALTLTAASFTAGAQTLSTVFTSSDHKVFTIYNARSVTFENGSVNITDASGSQSGVYLQDATGSVAVAMQNTPYFYKSFVRVGMTNRFVNADMIRWSPCQNGKTVLGWVNAGAETLDDNCALHYAMVSRSNNPQ